MNVYNVCTSISCYLIKVNCIYKSRVLEVEFTFVSSPYTNTHLSPISVTSLFVNTSIKYCIPTRGRSGKYRNMILLVCTTRIRLIYLP